MTDMSCPLDPSTFLRKSEPFLGSIHLNAIEDHVSTCKSCPHPPLNQFVFGEGPLKGSTPLLLACHFGKLLSVKHMIESWQVDVQASGTYYLHPTSLTNFTTIEKASPLFVAAYRGHSRVVRYLLEQAGADVSARTLNAEDASLNGLTPLYGAVAVRWSTALSRTYHITVEELAERTAIVLSLLKFGANPITDSFRPSDGRPMWIKPLCDFQATVALVNHGLDMNQCDSQGRTVMGHLLNSIEYFEEDSLMFVKLMLDKGADPLARDKRGFTPLLYAAFNCRWKSLDFLLKRDDIGMKEKIGAMELAGAQILFKEENSPHFPRAFKYWRRALRLRLQMEEESSGPNQNLPNEEDSRAVVTVGWRTREQLEHIIQDPIERKIQSVLILFRIPSNMSSSALLDVVECLYDDPPFLNLMNDGEQVGLLDIHWAMLHAAAHHFDPKEEEFWDWTVAVTKSLLNKLWIPEIMLPTRGPTPDVITKRIIRSLHLLQASDSNRPVNVANITTKVHYSVTILSFLDLVLLLLDLQSLTEDIILEPLMSFLRQLGPSILGSMLLFACGSLFTPRSFITAIRLLLEAGANLDQKYDNTDRDGPLHLVARLDHSDSEAIGCLLVGYGAKLHTTNEAGKIAVDIWKERYNELGHSQSSFCTGSSVRAFKFSSTAQRGKNHTSGEYCFIRDLIYQSCGLHFY